MDNSKYNHLFSKTNQLIFIFGRQKIYTAEAGLHTYTFVLQTKHLALQGRFGSGHPPSAEYRCAGGRGSPSLSLPQSTRSSKDLLRNILKLIHLALRQAEDVLTQAHLRKQQFLRKSAGKTMSACKCSHPRENYTGTAEMDTVLAMTTAPSSLHGHRRILAYCTCTCESSTH